MIIHLDADAFFASVEQASDTRLRGKPMAVGGEKRGIIASASYEARKFGIYTPMPTVMARRLCPKLILVPGDFEKYELFSRLMFSYAYDFTPDVEIGSIDEGYFDLSGVRKSPITVAETIQKAIRQSLHLSVSEGIGSNKLISQIASKLKKPAAFELVPPGSERDFLSPLSNKWLPGVGPKTANQLNAAGLARVGQIAQTPPDLLHLLVGNMALQMRNYALGVDERPVIPVRPAAKSYGEQETFAVDTTDEPFLEATLRRMADKLMAKVRDDGKSVRTLTVKVRYNDMEEDQAAESLAEPTDLETEVYSCVSRLLKKAWKRRVSLRLVSLRLSNVYEGRFRLELPLEISAKRHETEQRLADVVDAIREKFGRTVLLRGHDFVLRAPPGLCGRNGGEIVRPRGQRSSKLQTPHFREASNSKFQSGQNNTAGQARVSLPPTTPYVVPCKDGLRQAVPDKEVRRLTSTATDKGMQLSESTIAYHAAVVQRQRLGNYAARQAPDGKARKITVSPGPELKVRILTEQLKPEIHTSSQVSTYPRIHVSTPSGKERGSFTPLNVHSYFSFLDSTLSPQAIVEMAMRHELPAMALTDRGNLHGAVEFAQAAVKGGIKPIIGVEVRLEGRRVCLYVENEAGYRNLCRILNWVNGVSGENGWRLEEGRAESGGIHRTPNASRNLRIVKWSGVSEKRHNTAALQPRKLSGLAELDRAGLLAVSPHLEFAEMFPAQFYLEVGNREALEKYAEHRPALPCVGASAVRYELPGDRWKYDIVQSIRTLTLLKQAHPAKRLDGHFHFRPSREMQRIFAAHPELLAHSVEIAERCNFAFALGTPQFPSFPAPTGFTPANYLRHLVLEGLKRRYPKTPDQFKAQVEQELAIILDVGYEEYFLVMWDILQECRRRGIEWITRGSAADSLACYCLEISGVCPIRFDLYFRRFLNKDRMALNKLPDIDVDFPHDRKDDVIDLIFEKYGPEHTAIVGGFSTFQSRSAFAEVAKVLGVSEFQVRRITERLPHFSRASELVDAVTVSQECRDLPMLHEEPYRTALLMAHFLDGFPRYPKMHPCGLVLSRQKMDEITPCFTSAKGYPTTHFDMDSVESVGLIKMDILAQGGLAVMRDVQEMLNDEESKRRERGGGRETQRMEGSRGESITKEGVSRPFGTNENCSNLPRVETLGYAHILPPGEKTACLSSSAMHRNHERLKILQNLGLLEPWEDPEVWKLIADGNARAVHHIESPAMVSLCRMCNVRDIDTLIAIVSVIRPGAANESKKMEFTRRYQRLSPIYYPHPSLEPCLRSTFGLVVYEEHILQICEAFANLPPGRADVLRRALAKDRSEIIEEIHQEFIACARRTGRTEEKIAEVWEYVIGFKGYAFCKAHSTAYGVEAYQSAWLKRYYPAEFMAAVLTNGKGFYAPLVYVLECHRLGIPLLPPSVNEPGPGFVVIEKPPHLDRTSQMADRKAIRVPVLNVKGLTNRTKETIQAERARGRFTSLHDFFLRVQPLNEEMEALIQAGAFDEFGKSRTIQYWEFKANAQSVEGERSCEKKGRKDTPHVVSCNNNGNRALYGVSGNNAKQQWLLPAENLERLPSVLLAEPERLQCLRWEEELFGYPVSGHPLELYPDIAWDTYCPIKELGKHIGEQIVTCGLVIEQRLFHQSTGEPMKFLTIADWTGVVETELFAKTYQSYGLNTIRYRVLEIMATVEPFENGRGFSLRVQRASGPRRREIKVKTAAMAVASRP